MNDFGFESNLLSIIIALFQFPATEVMFVNSSLHVFVLHLKTTRCVFLKLFLANNSSSLVSVQNPYFLYIYFFNLSHTHTHTHTHRDKAIVFFFLFLIKKSQGFVLHLKTTRCG